MTTEKLIAILRKHPNKEVVVHAGDDDGWTARVLGSSKDEVWLGQGDEHRNAPDRLYNRMRRE